MKNCKTLLPLLLAATLMAASLTGCGGANQSAPQSSQPEEPAAEQSAEEGVIDISFAGQTVLVDGQPAASSADAPVYTSNDIIYYQDRVTYDNGNAYGEGEEWERHTQQQAQEHTVVNIAQPGTYRLQGQLTKGQVRVDLGKEASTDPNAVVTLIFDGADITCEVAPAVLFMNVYECDNGWSTETATADVDTSAAGANVIIADGSTNNLNGSHVARIYKDTGEEKKLWKQDGAFYSYMSMNINGGEEGSGVMNIVADNEGLDSELHLTINGGNLNIYSDNDGVNTNEDGVSVTTINGGNLHIIAGLGAEGDGVDSNGWLVINGGTVVAAANPAADAGLDSDMGSYINGGTVVALGSTMDWAESDSEQVTMNLQFAQYEQSDSAIVITDEEDKVVFAYDPSEDEVVAENIRQFMGAIVSAPQLELGKTYRVFVGGSLTGTERAGIYDTATVTGVEGAVLQQYTGTDVHRRPGGMMGGRGEHFDPENMPEGFEGRVPPEGFEKGERPEPPEGFEGRTPPEGFEDRIPPEGFELPEGMEPPEDFEGRFPYDRMEEGEIVEGNPSTQFFMQDKVNNFSGVTAAQ